MKGHRRFLALTLAMLMMLNSASVLYASTATTIEKRTTSDAKQVSMPTDSHEEDTIEAITLSLKRPSDTFYVYQMAEMKWNANGRDANVVWVETIQNWIATDAFKTWVQNNGYTYADFASPETMVDSKKQAAVEEKKLISFLNYLRTSGPLNSITPIAEVSDPDAASKEPATGNTGKTDNVTKLTDSTGEEYRITSLPLGLYFVDAKVNDTKAYQPLFIDLSPKQTGPSGHWYVTNKAEELTFSLKFEDLTINKTINGKKEEIVQVGQIVDFVVELDIPQYSKDGSGNYTFATYNAYDDMEQGFTLIPSSAKLYYYDAGYKEAAAALKEDPDNADKKTEVAKHVYHPTPIFNIENGTYVVSDAEASYTATLASGAKVFYLAADSEKKDVLYATPTNTPGSYQFWGKVKGTLESLGAYTITDSNLKEILGNYNSKLTAASENTFSFTYGAGFMLEKENTKSLISVAVEYSKLMSLKNQTLGEGVAFTAESAKGDNTKPGTAFVADKMYVTYSAVVNKDAYVGNDDNTNKVYLTYVSDSAGTLATISDTVRAWTYGTNVVKVDGATVGIQDTDASGNPKVDGEGNPIYKDPKYLDGAIFSIFEKDAIYCGGADATTEPNLSDISGLTQYKFLQGADGKNATDSMAAYKAQLSVMAKYAMTESGVTDPSEVMAGVGAVLGAVGDVTDLPNHKAKYDGIKAVTAAGTVRGNSVTVPVGEKVLASYLIPQISDKLFKYQYVAEEVDACDSVPTKHYHVQVYKLFWSDITSTNTADGITVKGLDFNDYLLVETTAPGDYNPLNEALGFSIKKDDARYAVNKSYKTFVSDKLADEDGLDGIYNITVENYKGLVLPSTGGMGTLLFTIIGIIIMFSAILIVVVRNRRKNSLEL